MSTVIGVFCFVVVMGHANFLAYTQHSLTHRGSTYAYPLLFRK